MKSLLLALLVALAPQVKVTFYTPDVVRIQKVTEGSFPESGSLAVVAAPETVPVTVRTSRGGTTYSSARLRVTVNADGRVTFSLANGKKLLQEGETAFVPRKEGLDKGAYEITQQFLLESGEPLYGLGILQDGQLSLSGKTRYLRQDNTEDFVPIVQSVKGYGILWDNPSTGTFTDKDDVASFSSEVGLQEDYYFLYGGSADGVIQRLRSLTGHVPMLPLWTYGFFQSRERYKSSRELLDALQGYRNRQIPIDGIIQDWQYWGNNYQWNAMEFLNEDFRNAQQMIDRVHQSNAHMLISIWASFGPMTKPYRELEAAGHLLHFATWPQSGLPDWPPRRDYPSGVLPYDAFSAEAREIYWKHLLRLEKMGIDGWWMDSTEPDHLDYKDSDLEQMTGLGSYRSVLNAYPLLSVSGVVEKQLEGSDRRPFVLTRSVYAGQQRTGANTWSGDVQSTWDDFRHQIPAGLGFTLTGNPNFNSDIGGFFPSGYNKRGETATCARNPRFQELYVRWLQFGLFNPMMRSHGESSRREIWEFGEPGEPVYDAIEKAIRLRYSLLPYIYSTSWQVSSADDSFMRALWMDYPADKRTWECNDEFFFGRSLLVAPVTHAFYTSEERRWQEEPVDWSPLHQSEVYLPHGLWYDWFSGTPLKGGRSVKADAPLDRCPVFAKAGAIVPLGPDVQYCNEKPWDNLEIRIFLGADGQFTLYEDAFDGQAYKEGAHSTIGFTLKGRTLKIGARKGSYPGMLESRQFRLTVYGADGKRSEKTVDYNGNELTIKL
ncbi:MAG: glycoside hydrolase family 31 protein [Bacteroidales bacterium]|nr:glycoside hydrolase family 31 protein [Bacteroidales bacterium]